MANTSNTKLPKPNLVPDTLFYTNCKFRLRWPSSKNIQQDSCMTILNRLKQESKGKGPDMQRKKLLDQRLKERQKLLCFHEDPVKRAEINRRRMIQKIKRIYRINLDELQDDAANEIILKVNILEKQKREKEKRQREKNIKMMTRLIEEQKYKRRGMKPLFPQRLKTVRILPCIEMQNKEEEKIQEEIKEEEEEEEITETVKFEVEENILPAEIFERRMSASNRDTVEANASTFAGEDYTEINGEILDLESLPKASKCVLREKSLEASPPKVIFDSYQKNKSYLQELRITNVGLESVHCRYLGIAVHTEGEDKFPVGVAVRDNVLLHPGLSCGTKVRLYAKEDTKNLECSIVYETRRKGKPFQHAWFLVPVVCYPSRAIIKVTPLKIVFPSLTWFEAKRPEGLKLYKKFLKFENSGSKGCTCKILKERKIVSIYGEMDDFGNDYYEAEMESGVVRKIKKESAENQPFEEYNTLTRFESINIASEVIDELLENIFATFRFSRKYHIELPPLSTKYVEVKFRPQYKGFHHDIYYIHFEDCNITEEMIELTGNIKKLPIKAEPTIVDLKICTINSGVYTSNFKIFNESKGTYAIALKVPPVLRNHCHVIPQTTTILAHDFRDFSIIFYPGITLRQDASKYYKKDLGVLEFPIHIHPASITACKLDFIKIYAFAVITDYILELNPQIIDFGTVSTLETVNTKITLTNHSLAVQEFGFLKLPKGLAVEPNMGFGTILPQETITLEVFYSPVPSDDDCNEKEESRVFELEVTTIAECGKLGKSFDKQSTLESSWVLDCL